MEPDEAMNEERQTATDPAGDPAAETGPAAGDGAPVDEQPDGSGAPPDDAGAQGETTSYTTHAEWDKRVRERLTRQGEEAIGKLAQGMLEHPVVTGAVSAAFDARARALRAQEAAMAALNLPSASDLERLTRRLRNVSQRMEAVEEGLDRLEEGVHQASVGSVESRLDRIEASLTRIEAVLGSGGSGAGGPASAGASGAIPGGGPASDPGARPESPHGGPPPPGEPPTQGERPSSEPGWRSPWQG
jgi:hypothetical protein